MIRCMDGFWVNLLSVVLYWCVGKLCIVWYVGI